MAGHSASPQPVKQPMNTKVQKTDFNLIAAAEDEPYPWHLLPLHLGPAPVTPRPYTVTFFRPEISTLPRRFSGMADKWVGIRFAMYGGSLAITIWFPEPMRKILADLFQPRRADSKRSPCGGSQAAVLQAPHSASPQPVKQPVDLMVPWKDLHKDLNIIAAAYDEPHPWHLLPRHLGPGTATPRPNTMILNLPVISSMRPLTPGTLDDWEGLRFAHPDMEHSYTIWVPDTKRWILADLLRPRQVH